MLRCWWWDLRGLLWVEFSTSCPVSVVTERNRRIERCSQSPVSWLSPSIWAPLSNPTVLNTDPFLMGMFDIRLLETPRKIIIILWNSMHRLIFADILVYMDNNGSYRLISARTTIYDICRYTYVIWSAASFLVWCMQMITRTMMTAFRIYGKYSRTQTMSWKDRE